MISMKEDEKPEKPKGGKPKPKPTPQPTGPTNPPPKPPGGG